VVKYVPHYFIGIAYVVRRLLSCCEINVTRYKSKFLSLLRRIQQKLEKKQDWL